MSYCEVAGRDCKYLDRVEDLRKSMVLARATVDDPKRSAEATVAATIAEEWLNGDGDCAADECRLVARAISNMIVTEALYETATKGIDD
ncbi:hypothetical protein BVY00_00215 [bacterium G20]|nr:hypothetical protein BVY00_00215 [bacterium G20]